MRKNKYDIFQEVKAYINDNPNCLSGLFPAGRQKGTEYYFDEPNYNSWSYNIHKGIVKDFRSDERQDIIRTYQIVHNINKPIDAVKEMTSKLGINHKNNNYKGGQSA